MNRLITMLFAASLLAGWSSAHAESYFKDGEIHLIQSSHHDLGWHKLSYENEVKFTCQEINKALDLMKADPEFKFTGEYTVYLQEYIKRFPERVDELKQRFEEGRMEWGAGFTMPYTSLMTGEQLARQMYYGRKWFNAEFPSEASIYFNTDIPGFCMQMPQILSKSGVDKAYLSRPWNLVSIDNDFLTWSAPDGSDVFCYFMYHYGNHVGTYEEVKMGDNGKMADWVRSWQDYYIARKIPPHLLHYLCMDCRMPENRRESIDVWNAYAQDNGMPRMQYSTLEEGMDAVRSEDAEYKSITGEWPNKWLYEAAPSNYEIFSDLRDSDRLLRAAEAFSTFRALLEGNFEHYPSEKLEKAWKQATFSCHGWAPDPVIDLYKKTYRDAHETAGRALGEALDAIASRVKTKAEGAPLVVFNALSWPRTDIVEIAVPEGAPETFHVVDSDGTEVPHQATDDGRIVFRARDVPSFGYKTYYLAEGAGKASAESEWKPGSAWDAAFENKFYRIDPAAGGLGSIYDKTLERELLKTDKFRGAEWLDFEYKGMGAGEFVNIVMPTPTGYDRLSKYESSWKCVEVGPVRTVFEMGPIATPHGKVILRLAAYETLKRLDLTCLMLDCDQTPAREMRLAFPLNGDLKQVAYEGPFDVVKVGKSELEPTLAFGDAAVRPREVQNWIYAGGEKGGVTIGSSVACWDYADASEEPVDYPVLQPVLLTSAESCHWEKGPWLQPGDHEFTFSIYSHKPGWRNGYRDGIQANNPLLAVAPQEKSADSDLPETRSFLSISPTNMIVTAVKQSEAGGDMVVRFYETEGESDNPVRVNLDADLSDARRTNLVEEDAGNLNRDEKGVSLKVGAYSIETVQLTPDLGSAE